MLVAYSTYVSISVQRMGSQLLISSATETAWRCPTAFSKDRCDQEAVRLRIILSALTTLNFIFKSLPPLPLLFGVFYTLCVGFFCFWSIGIERLERLIMPLVKEGQLDRSWLRRVAGRDLRRRVLCRVR